MAAPQEARKPGSNKLLPALPGREREQLLSHPEQVGLGVDDILYEPDRPIRHVYFPTAVTREWENVFA